jgi:D-serine deaminase-like pyridoxal phosphate-dependent protein
MRTFAVVQLTSGWLPVDGSLWYPPAMKKHDVDTPALLLDLDVMEANIAAMAAFFRDRPQKLRPHFKTPKTPEIARRQLEAGAIGITAAKLGEAEVLVNAGLGRVLIANQIVGRQKVDRLMDLLGRGEVIVAVESELNIRELEEGAARSGHTPQAIVEVDVGMHRCGTANPEETVELAQRLADGPIRYRGIMGYEGHAVLIADAADREAKARASMERLSAHVRALRDAGLAPEIVSSGGTGTFDIAGSWPDVTEVQAGSYVFMDGRYRGVRPDLGQPALTMLVTVIARHGDYAVIDAGMKALTNEFGPPVGIELHVTVSRLSEEHGTVDVGDTDLRPGMKFEILPSHNDTTLNLHGEYYVCRGDEVIDVWPISAARAYR